VLVSDGLRYSSKVGSTNPEPKKKEKIFPVLQASAWPHVKTFGPRSWILKFVEWDRDHTEKEKILPSP